jgi:hypothetical protein
MFKKVINHEGFWRSVVSLGIAFALIFTLIKWGIDGFNSAFFSENDPVKFFLGALMAGLVYGFFVTFGKFRTKLKNKEPLE